MSNMAATGACNGAKEPKSWATFEDALASERGRRASFETWAAGKLDALVSAAVRRVEASMQEHLISLHRRCADEVRERVNALVQELGAVRHRLTNLEQVPSRWASSDSPEAFEGRRAFASLDNRVALLERSQSKPGENLSLEVARQLQVMRLQLLDEGSEQCRLVVDGALADSSELRKRLNALERWLQETVAPEVVRAQLDLEVERQERQRALAAIVANLGDPRSGAIDLAPLTSRTADLHGEKQDDRAEVLSMGKLLGQRALAMQRVKNLSEELAGSEAARRAAGQAATEAERATGLETRLKGVGLLQPPWSSTALSQG